MNQWCSIPWIFPLDKSNVCVVKARYHSKTARPWRIMPYAKAPGSPASFTPRDRVSLVVSAFIINRPFDDARDLRCQRKYDESAANLIPAAPLTQDARSAHYSRYSTQRVHFGYAANKRNLDGSKRCSRARERERAVCTQPREAFQTHRPTRAKSGDFSVQRQWDHPNLSSDRDTANQPGFGAPFGRVAECASSRHLRWSNRPVADDRCRRTSQWGVFIT